ncbi:DUF3060 domain-containing protein [Luteimonas sp. FCS-9]|uniref:DUF3060 domain-containing protein n=1 Tax=Luteimonas sp. FCS-9 TaxID=1547516 RepID=UPI00063E9951|nr:DUF3060 domain-containing protein [Luteimonas sp. FCS-9]KLJ02955.1 hypothetical protein WQ56_01455 [Luteimonas sp. FCS-9]
MRRPALRSPAPLTAGLLVAALAACGGPADDAPIAADNATSPATPGTLRDPASGAPCAGRDVHVTRDAFRIVLDGACGAVLVTASRGAINVDHATSLRVAGDHVTVLNRRVGDVEVTGSDNTLNLTEAGEVRIGGDRNTVLARNVTSVEFEGAGNTVDPSNAPDVHDDGRDNRVL